MVKRNEPLLTPRHRRNRLGHAIAHQDWTVEDWKRVTFPKDTKINRLGPDGRKWTQKLPGEGLTDRLAQGTLKFGGGSVIEGGACHGQELGIAAGWMAGWMETSTQPFWTKT